MTWAGAAAGWAWWVVVLLALAGVALGGVTGRILATGGYRTEFDEAGDLPRHWWWPAVVLGGLWGWLGWRIGDHAGWATLPAFLLLAWLAVGLVWIDADVHRLPDGLVLPAYPALGLLAVVASVGAGDWHPLVRGLACMVGSFLLYVVLAFVARGQLGFGDVKLSGVIGLVLGLLGVMDAVEAVLLAFLVGGVLSLVMLAGRRVGLRSFIAFGPAMLIGAFLALAVDYRPF